MLEIGFGNGHFLAYAQEKGYRIVGTEIHESLLRIARESGFFVIHANDLATLNPEQFDLIVAFDVLEHLQSEGLSAFLSNMRNLLRAGGIFLTRFPNGESPFGLETLHGDIMHRTVLGRGKIEYFAESAGFSILSYGGEPLPIMCGSLKHFIHRILAVPLKSVLELITKALFLPKSKIVFLPCHGRAAEDSIT